VIIENVLEREEKDNSNSKDFTIAESEGPFIHFQADQMVKINSNILESDESTVSFPRKINEEKISRDQSVVSGKNNTLSLCSHVEELINIDNRRKLSRDNLFSI